MANLTSILKEEITRLARKEIKAETESFKKASSAYRSEIADLKRRTVSLEKQLSKFGKVANSSAVPQKNIEPEKIRFIAKGFKSMREKLGLTAGQIAGLLDVSPAIVYNWEGGLSKPKQPQLIRIAHLRTMGKKDVAAVLTQLSAPAPQSKAKAVKVITAAAKPKKTVKATEKAPPKAVKTPVVKSEPVAKATKKTAPKAKTAPETKVATKSVRKPRPTPVKQEATKETVVTTAPTTAIASTHPAPEVQAA